VCKLWKRARTKTSKNTNQGKKICFYSKNTRAETRKIAHNLELNVAGKPDSQDICFVPNGDYASVIRKYKPESFKPGDILDVKDKVIGKHKGIINFTIGQRKGIGISHEEPLYVVNIIAKENKVIVGNREALSIKKIYLKDINLLGDIENHSDGLFIKVRSTGKLIKAKIIMLTPEKFKSQKEKNSNTIKVNEDSFLDEFLPQVCLTPATVEVVDKSGNVKGYITEKELSKALTKSKADVLTKSKT